MPLYQLTRKFAHQSKENHMKKLAIPAALLIAALAFTGCATKGIVATPDKPKAVASAEPTVAPAPEPVAEEGTREAPLPFGQEVTVYNTATNEAQWLITVSAAYDATQEILDANQFNALPQFNYLAIPVHVVWQGVEPIKPWLDFQNGLEFSFVSADGVTSESVFVVQPWPSLMDIADLYQGGAADFVVVVDVAAGTPGLVRATAGDFDYFVGAL